MHNSAELQTITRTLQSFLALLAVERTLLRPHLYELCAEVVRTVLTQYREPGELALYLKDLFALRMATLAPVRAEELFLARVALETRELDAALTQAIDTHFLDGCQLADYVLSRSKECSLLELCECLQMARCLVNCDETGRVRLQEVLRKLATTRRELEAVRDGPGEAHNDVYEELSDSEM